MLVFYRTKACPRCDEVEERLRDLVVAYQVIYVDQNEAGGTWSGGTVPLLKEGDRIYATAAAVDQYLEALTAELALSRTYQSDACYLEPVDGKTCL